jgi:hypothetical protein
MHITYTKKGSWPNKHISLPSYQYSTHQPTLHALQFIIMITTGLVLGDIIVTPLYMILLLDHLNEGCYTYLYRMKLDNSLILGVQIY